MLGAAQSPLPTLLALAEGARRGEHKGSLSLPSQPALPVLPLPQLAGHCRAARALRLARRRCQRPAAARRWSAQEESPRVTSSGKIPAAHLGKGRGKPRQQPGFEPL